MIELYSALLVFKEKPYEQTLVCSTISTDYDDYDDDDVN